MRLWRLATSLYPPLTGEGARLHGGRWNSPGVPLIYASAHLSLAVLETLVHLDPGILPDTAVAHELDLPDDATEARDADQLPPTWATDLHVTRAIGDTWASGLTSLALLVPSVVIPAERNVLVNPRHQAVVSIQVIGSAPFPFDARLR